MEAARERRTSTPLPPPTFPFPPSAGAQWAQGQEKRLCAKEKERFRGRLTGGMETEGRRKDVRMPAVIFFSLCEDNRCPHPSLRSPAAVFLASGCNFPSLGPEPTAANNSRMGCWAEGQLFAQGQGWKVTDSRSPSGRRPPSLPTLAISLSFCERAWGKDGPKVTSGKTLMKRRSVQSAGAILLSRAWSGLDTSFHESYRWCWD